jgi:uncharacterized membrane protein YfcA
MTIRLIWWARAHNLTHEANVQSILLILLGITAGIVSGLVGIGGGIILVPALVFLFGLTQHQAQGTTLALMVPPIGIVAAWTYWRQGFVDLRIAALICVGFLIGSLLGARYAITVSDASLQRTFGVFLFLLSLKLIFGKGAV